jgi:hypothetical protein
MTKTAKNRTGDNRRPTSEKSPWSKRVLVVAGAVAFVLMVVVVINGTVSEPQGGVPEATEQVAVGDPRHVDGEIYDDHEVPAGGEHAAIWANCGFYSQPVSAENAVHSLEHGAVWITYAPDLSDSDLDLIRDLASPSEKVLASPVANQGSPIIATAWANQLDLDSATDPRLSQFVVEFAGSLSAPEPGGACNGGVGIPG